MGKLDLNLHLDTRATLIITYLVVSGSVDKVPLGPVCLGSNFKKKRKEKWRPNPPVGRLAPPASLRSAGLGSSFTLASVSTTLNVSLCMWTLPGRATQSCLISAGFSRCPDLSPRWNNTRRKQGSPGSAVAPFAVCQEHFPRARLPSNINHHKYWTTAFKASWAG